MLRRIWNAFWDFLETPLTEEEEETIASMLPPPPQF